VAELIADDYLKLSIAENDKLITTKIGDTIPGITGPSFLEEAKKLFEIVREKDLYVSSRLHFNRTCLYIFV
jgi:hypothetical protein